MKYNIVACGGTFDFLHAGHKGFLKFAFSLGKNVLIGLTSDQYFESNDKQGDITVFVKRKKVLEDFLRQENLHSRATIIPINDMYGPTVKDNTSIDALVVTEDTHANAVKINRERTTSGLSAIPIIIMPLLMSEHHVISSSSIRNGRIDREGKPFIQPVYYTHDLVLPEVLRKKLHKPFGTLFSGGNRHIQQLDQNKVVSVGDVTTARFNALGIKQKISVIDFVIERKRSYETVKQLGFTGNEEFIEIQNPAGMITSVVWKSIMHITEKIHEEKQFVIAVTGEEDLLVIPLLLCLPIGYHIFYGQPHEGLVQVKSTIKNKLAMREVLSQFTPSTTRGY